MTFARALRELYFARTGLRVRKGKRSAPLPIDGLVSLPQFTVGFDTSPTSVRLIITPDCVDTDSTYSHDQLEARLDHEEGATLARKGKHAAAERLFARAAALDPTYEAAARDHAVALLKLRRPDDAIHALAATIKRNPMGAYVKLEGDRQLAALLRRPGLAHLVAATPGTASIDAIDLSLRASEIARAPGGELAFVHNVSGSTCGYQLQLILRDTNLRELTALPLVEFGDFTYKSRDCEDDEHYAAPFSNAGKGRIRKRVTAANQLLAALGFSPLPVDSLKTFEEPHPGSATLHFASGRALLLGQDRKLRLLEAGKVLFERPSRFGDFEPVTFLSAVMIPGEHRVLVTDRSLGCDGQDGVTMKALSLK